MEGNSKTVRKTLKLSKDEQTAQTAVYQALDDMILQRNEKWPHFADDDGPQDLKNYLDNSDKRLNGLTPSREEQGKKDYQSNFFDPVTRNKLKAVVAGVALSLPEFKYKAVNKAGIFSSQRAELMKRLVDHSRMRDNPKVAMFFEAWEMAGKGTVIKYDGYLKTKYPRKYIKSYDKVTGEVVFDERDEVVDDYPVDLFVPLIEFYIWDFHIRGVQNQPRVAWVQHYNKQQLDQEFGKMPNHKYVKDQESCANIQAQQKTYFYDRWTKRTQKKDDFEVIRFYDKEFDKFEIWANGVPLLRVPLLWGKAEKKYPFADAILEPFTDSAFFYGKSLPHILMGIQDVDNTIINSVLDKMARGYDPAMLVGLANKDLLDLEDELVSSDNKIYVPNVEQVKPMPVAEVNRAELVMLDVIARKADLASVDANQQGIAGRGVTAREILIADENAAKLKGIFFTFLEDLWLQKNKLRVQNILANYMQPKYEAIIGKDGKEQLLETMKVFHIDDVEFSDGSRGTLGVGIAENPQKLPGVPEIEAREEIMKEQGINYKFVAATSDYLDDWEYDFMIIPETLEAKSQAKKQAIVFEKQQYEAATFPEWFVANKDKRYAEFLEIYDETIEEQTPPQPPAPPQPETPSRSISFKDLPTSGKVQLAEQAGIKLDPSELDRQKREELAAKNKGGEGDRKLRGTKLSPLEEGALLLGEPA